MNLKNIFSSDSLKHHSTTLIIISAHKMKIHCTYHSPICNPEKPLRYFTIKNSYRLVIFSWRDFSQSVVDTSNFSSRPLYGSNNSGRLGTRIWRRHDPILLLLIVTPTAIYRKSGGRGGCQVRGANNLWSGEKIPGNRHHKSWEEGGGF